MISDFDIIQKYKDEIAAKDKQIQEMEMANTKTLASIQVYTKQQKSLFDEFMLLRSKYDDVKQSLVSTLWTHTSLHHPDLKQIPHQEKTKEEGGTFVLTDDIIGTIIILLY